MASSLQIPIGVEDDRSTVSGRTTPRIRIGSLLLDPDTLELDDGQRAEVLRPLPAALLFHLLRQRHRIVSKDELHRVLWPDTSVSDAALASAVRDLRRLLDDDGETQEMIRTFRGRGYRLVAPVTVDAREPSSAGCPAKDGPTPAESFVGRERELAHFERVRLAAEGGHGGTLLVESVDGGGRSAFLDRCGRRATGVLWLGIRCLDEAWVPRFDAITRILLELEGAVGSDLVEQWRKADSELTHLMPDFLPRAAETGPQVEVLSGALRRVLERANRLAPVVIAVDDIHYIDRASLELLCAGAARTSLLVGTLDPGRVGDAVRSGIDALFSERSRVRLGGLTAADISSLARRLDQPGHDARWAVRLRERTAGHPADVWAMLGEKAGQEAAGPSAVALVPRTVSERITRRIRGLSRPARAFVTAASALPPGTPRTLVERLAGCASGSGGEDGPTEECVRAGLVSLRSHLDGVEPCGQLVRHVALGLLSAQRRRELERRATEVLRAAG